MDASNIISLLALPGGISGRLALVGLVWTLSASIFHLAASSLMLRCFSREGPVIPQLLPQLEHKWSLAEFRLSIWVWLRRIGLLLLFCSVCTTFVMTGLFVHTLLSSGVADVSWQRQLAFHVGQMLGALVLFLAGLAVRVVLGGLASLVLTRARMFVSASASLVSPQDVERTRRFLEELDNMQSPGKKR